MSDLTPRTPQRPLLWSDTILELQDMLIGFGKPIYAVGGAVRDAWLHRPIKDLDLAVERDSIRLARMIADAYDGDVFVMDDEREVARTFVDTPQGRLTIDVARFRGIDLLADLTDRDFTVNAMTVDFTSDTELLIDPLSGESDAKDKLIRRCSDHAIQDDPIRALRAVRQSVQLGFRIEPETREDLRAFGSQIEETSPERIRDEVYSILKLRRPAAAFRVLGALDLLRHSLPNRVDEIRADKIAWGQTLTTIEKLRGMIESIGPTRTDETAATFDLGMLVMQLDRFRNELYTHLSDTVWANDRRHEPLLVLAALLVTLKNESEIEQIAEKLRLSNAEKRRLVDCVVASRIPLALEDVSVLEIHRYWYQFGAAGVDGCLLALAHYLGQRETLIDQDAWLMMIDKVRILLEGYFRQYEQVVYPPLLLDGNQLQEAFELKPGRIIGELLTAIREAQVVGEIETVDEALSFVEQYLTQHGGD